MNLEEYESQHAEWSKADQQVRAEMTLEAEITNSLAQEMDDTIDFIFIEDMLCKDGWVKFEIPRFIDNHHAVDISYWLADYCQGEYKRNGRTFLFKESKDATMFILRWGS